MDAVKVDFSKSVAMDETDDGRPSPNKISNPGYSPVVLRNVESKAPDPVYEEMGTINPVFVAEEKVKKSTLNSFNKQASLQMAPSFDETKFETVFDADNYLTPTNSNKRPPISPIGSGPSPHYADIHDMKKVAQYDTPKESRNSMNGRGLPKRKQNIAYEPSEIKKKDVYLPQKEIEYNHSLPSWIIFALLIVGLLAVLAIVLFLLLLTGTVESKGCGCNSGKSGATQGNTGKQSTQSYVNDTELTARLQQLESNLTSLKMKFVPVDQEIARIKNMSVANSQLIANLSSGLAELATDKDRLQTKTNQDLKAVESRLNSSITALQKLLQEEQEKVNALNTTVQELSRLHKGLQSNMNGINQTQTADVRKLSEKLETQGSKLASLNYSNTMSISSLQASIENEVTFRQGNDSVLQSLITQNSVITQVSIANLSFDLVALTTKTNKDIKAVESRLNSSIHNISLTPGPVGAAGRNGSGNMSLCTESMSKVVSADSDTIYATTIVPKENVIVGEFCHATIPVGVTIRTISGPDDSIVRQCKCKASAKTLNWECTIRVWSCPRIN